MGDNASHDSTSGYTRREALKRGLQLTGAVVWATPIIQTVGMSPAMAQTTSPSCQFWYAVKLQGGTCSDIYNQTASDGPAGHCLDVDSYGVTPQAGGCDHIVSMDTEGPTWTAVLDEGCQFGLACCIKAGSETYEGACDWNPVTRTITFQQQGQNAISHVEFLFCCDH